MRIEKRTENELQEDGKRTKNGLRAFRLFFRATSAIYLKAIHRVNGFRWRTI